MLFDTCVLHIVQFLVQLQKFHNIKRTNPTNSLKCFPRIRQLIFICLHQMRSTHGVTSIQRLTQILHEHEQKQA